MIVRANAFNRIVQAVRLLRLCGAVQVIAAHRDGCELHFEASAISRKPIISWGANRSHHRRSFDREDDDGTKFECKSGDVSLLLSGHDAWVVGNVDFKECLRTTVAPHQQHRSPAMDVAELSIERGHRRCRHEISSHHPG